MADTFRAQTLALVRDIWREYRWQAGALVLLMSAVALVDGLGMALLLPLLIAIGVAPAGEGSAPGAVLDRALGSVGLNRSPYHIAAALLAIFVVQMALYVAQQWWVSRLQRDYGARWQKRLFEAFVRARWSFLAEQKLGDLTNLIAQETFRLAGACLIVAQLVAMLIATAVYVAVALSIAWPVTVMMVALAAALFVAVRGLGRRNFQIGMRLGPLASELSVLLTESFAGIKLIKATSSERAVTEQVARVIDEMSHQHTWATFLPSLVRAIFELAAIAALCFILVFGYQQLGIPAASLLVVLALFVRLLPRFNALQQNLQMLATYVPAFDEARTVLAAATSASERDAARLRPDSWRPLAGAVTIKIARAGYGNVTVLRDITLQFPERGLVGIVGESGAGKSTLVNCLLGLADVQSGDVRLGDVGIRDVPLDVWRRQIGYVPQETVLFHLSIRDNVAWTVPAASDADVERAARHALAHDFIVEQPHGYSTVIGDQGAKLSGGQRQRLSIARALMQRPRVLILDEATNALDSMSEHAVLQTVEQLRTEMCVVMVAHRLTAVRTADLIVVFEHGRATEAGSWSDLAGRHGAFSRLVAAR
jgi:ATP-binding cassette subfamily C protein